jgi:hypothetical protein
MLSPALYLRRTSALSCMSYSVPAEFAERGRHPMPTALRGREHGLERDVRLPASMSEPEYRDERQHRRVPATLSPFVRHG